MLTSYRRGLHLWLALGNVLLAASELHHSSCRSVGHPDDSDGAACFGWCSPAFGGEHCSWCRCRGCVFCDAIALANPAAAASFATVISGSAGPVSGRNPTPAGGGGIMSGSTPSVSSGVTTVAATALGSGDGTGADESSVCQSSIADDVSYKDCQPFCSPAFRDDHCAACKCRACHFCGCSSELADDSPDERCESWCSADFEDAHCAACKCKGCQFCRMGKACTPADESDSNTESCDAFCDAKFASSHCNQCKCKRCGFCRPGGAHGGVLGHDGGGGGGAGARGGNGGGGGAGGKTGGKEKDGGGNPGHASAHAASHDTGFLPLGAACSSDAPIGVWDSEESACESFCSSEHRSAHCALCKCRACDLCKCQSAVANDSEEERCEPWCSRSFHAVHCGMCKCKACGFCVHGVACAPFEQGDSEVERCEAFCKPSFADAHCQMCKCRGCSFCSTVYPPEPPKPPRPPLPPLAAPAPPPIPPRAKRAPEPPKFLEVTGATCGSLSLKWQPPADRGFPIEAYEVVFQRLGPSPPGSPPGALTGSPQPSPIPKAELPPAATFTVTSPRIPLPPAAELPGLSPSTVYHLRVRAHTSGGTGLLSTPITAATATPLRPPQTPDVAPTLQLHHQESKADGAGEGEHDGACGRLAVTLPPLRSGCSGDERYALEYREAQWAAEGPHVGWIEAPASAYTPSPTTTTKTTLTSRHLVPAASASASASASSKGTPIGAGTAALSGLDASKAYQVRLVAHNARGSSAAGPPSSPLLVGVSSSAADKAAAGALAPSAVAAGVAAVVIVWGGTGGSEGGHGEGTPSCRPDQTWEILVQRPRDTNEAERAVTGADEAHPEGDPGSASDRTSGQRAHHGKDAAGEWQTVATGLRGTQAALPSMRCPKGCRFKVHAEGITGWSVYSEASAAVATNQEPPMPQGAVRLEVAARLEPPSTPSDLVAAINDALGLPSGRCRVAYSYALPAPYESTSAVKEEKEEAAIARVSAGRMLSSATAAESSTPAAAPASLVTYVTFDILEREDGSIDAATEAGEAGPVASSPGRAGEGNRGGGGAGATAQGAAEALAGLMASHSRLLWGHSVSEWIVPSAGLIQVYTDGRQRHLWSTADANAAAEQSLLSTARLITTGLVVTAVVIGCLMTCSAQLGGREYGSVITAEE